jgi:hypothetical protein
MLLRGEARVREVERQYARARLAAMTYQEALAIFSALWQEARTINPGYEPDWRMDIAPDLAVARAVNGLPPTA